MPIFEAYTDSNTTRSCPICHPKPCMPSLAPSHSACVRGPWPRTAGSHLLPENRDWEKARHSKKIAHQLDQIPDLTVGVMQRPQSKLGDFYREMGELFNVNLSPSNRYGGFKALRDRWQRHCQSTLLKPVLLIDEAQQVSTECLTELRILQSHRFDSQSLLFTILCGDNRLPDRFRTADLLPLGSRIGLRLLLEPLSPEQLQDYLYFALETAGNSQLMSDELILTLSGHAANNLRVLNQMAAELLATAAQQNLPRIDESLFFTLFSPSTAKSQRRRKK